MAFLYMLSAIFDLAPLALQIVFLSINQDILTEPSILR